MVLLDTLEDITFLHDLAPEYRSFIASVGRLKEYAAGAVLFRAGQDAADVYLLCRGIVALEISGPGGEPAAIQTVGPGELLGWSPLLGLGPMTATARAVTPCRAVALAADRLLALGKHDPRFGMELLRRAAAVLARRLAGTRRRLLEAGCPAPQPVPAERSLA